MLLPAPLHAQLHFHEQARPIVTHRGMGLLAASDNRRIIGLNGQWEYRLSDDDTWRQVTVPSSYEEEASVTFRRDFTIDRKEFRHGVFQLVALSVSHYCEIRINGQFVGKHAGESSFSFKLTPGLLRPGRNSIEIDVNNRLNARETIPLREQLWDPSQYGGIVQDIAIVITRGVWVQETVVQSAISGRSAVIDYRAYLNSGEISNLPGDTAAAPVEFGRSTVQHYFELVDAATENVVAVSEMKQVTVESDRLIPVDLRMTVPEVVLWTPDSPVLYLLRQKTMRGGKLIDESYTYVGFRTITSGENGFMLNGSPLFLKAVSYVEDSPRHGRSLSLDEMERDVLLIKNLGANAVRLVGGSPHPHFLSLCDRYGLLVLLDLPVHAAPSSLLGNAAIQASARNALREMLARDFNHPSLVALGLAQGVDPVRSGYREYLESFASQQEGDRTHLYYASFFAPPPADATSTLDVVGVDIYPHTQETVEAALHAIAGDSDARTVFVSSLAYPVQVGNYNGYSDPRSIDAQGEFFLSTYNVLRELKIPGVVVHTFTDWRVQRPLMSVDRVQQYTATLGIVDRFRQKRISYDVLKSRFNNEKPPVLVTGSYEEQHPPSFVVIGILIIFIFAVVYNLFRRFRENVVRAVLRPYNFFSDVRDQRMLSIFQTSVIGLVGSLSAALIYANILYAWRMNFLFDAVLSQFVHANWLKQWLDYAAWNPLQNILLTTVALFLFLVLLALMIRLASLLVRRKVLLFDAYSVTMWSVLPMVFLAPFGMVLYRLMEMPFFEVAAVLAYVVFHVWVISRFLKGTAIVFDIRPLYFHIAGTVILLVALGSWLLTLDGEYRTFAYVDYFVNLWHYLSQITS